MRGFQAGLAMILRSYHAPYGQHLSRLSDQRIHSHADVADTFGVEHVASSNGADVMAEGAQLEDAGTALHDPGPTKVEGGLLSGSEHLESAVALGTGFGAEWT